jgi:hypothetical protein
MLPLPAAPYEACEKIACASQAIVRHKRSYEREAVVFDPLRCLALLEQKTRPLDQAAPLAGWQLPECFAQQRRLPEARLKKNGSREYVQVLRLLETFDLPELTLAIEDALRLGTISFRHRASSAALPYRTKTAATGHAELSSPTDGAGAYHPGRRLHELACGSVRMSGAETSSTNSVTHTADTPQLLLEHHLKELRLPTILREYDKVSRQVRGRATGLSTLPATHDRAGVDGTLAPRNRTPHPAGQGPGHQDDGQLRLPAHSDAEQDSGTGAGAMRVRCPPRERTAAGQQRHGQNAHRLALGLAARQRGHRVRFTTAAALVSELIEARE